MKKNRLQFGIAGVFFCLILFFTLGAGTINGSTLNTNGSFENTEPGAISDSDDVDGWEFSGIGTLANFSIVEDPVQHGNKALTIEVLETGENAWNIEATSVNIPVEPGSDYRYSIWAKSDNSGAEISITVGNYDYNEYGRQTVDLTDEWQRFTLNFTISDDKTEIRAPIHFSYAANVENTIYIDNLEITQLTAPDELWQGPPIASGHDKWFGNIWAPGQMAQFTAYWNQVTPENASKWGSVAGHGTTPDPATWNWTNLDIAYNFAKENGFPFRFHVLIWGGQQPPWINDLSTEDQLEAITNWYNAVNERYPEIEYLEVVNEPLHQRPDGETGTADYWDALGGRGETNWDWVINAFQMARDIFPETTKLMINDYNLMSNSSNVSNYLEIIELLQEKDLIDGIGMQGHGFSYWGSTQDYINNINSLAETGLPIQVTEMDLDGPTDRTHYNNYTRIFTALWNHEAIEGITLWGWRRGMWRSNEGAYLIDPETNTERPALSWLRNYLMETYQFGMQIPEGEGTVEPAVGNHHSYDGEVITITATPADGWLFHRWEGSVDDRNSNETTTTLNSNYDFVKAIFVEDDSTPTTSVYELEFDSKFMLNNFPNPFSHATKISFNIIEEANVSLKVFDTQGRLIKTLVNENKTPGNYTIDFESANLSNGVYFYRLEAGRYSDIKRMMIIK